MDINDVALTAKLLRDKFPESTFARPGMDELLDMYAIFALTKGAATTNRDVHHAWVIWARRHDPSNPDIVSYDDLSKPIQDEDSPFMQAIHEVAATLSPRHENTSL